MLTMWIAKPNSTHTIFRRVNKRDSWYSRCRMRLPLFQVIYDTLCNHSLYAHNFPYCKRNKYLNCHNTFVGNLFSFINYWTWLPIKVFPLAWVISGFSCLSLSSPWTHMIISSLIDQLSLCVLLDIFEKISYLDERIK